MPTDIAVSIVVLALLIAGHHAWPRLLARWQDRRHRTLTRRGAMDMPGGGREEIWREWPED